MSRTIYIEGRFTTQRLTGVQRYAGEITRALDRIVGAEAPSLRIVLLQPREGASLGLHHIEERRIASGGSHAWTQFHFLRAARRGVALSLASSGPVLHRRQVVVIHDAAIYRHPDFYSKSYRVLHKTLGQMLAKTATIATVSEFSRGELAQFLKVPAARIVVAPNGSEHLQIAPDRQIVDKLGLAGRPFFLVLGSLTTNKNLAVVIRALAHLPGNAARIVAVGDVNDGIFGKLSIAPNPDFLMPGRLSDAEIAGLMGSARALIFPSIYEGFGIPPLEAMTHGCPVLASTAPAVMEVCGDAADYFPAHDDTALAGLLRKVLSDHDGSWRSERVRAGAERVGHFSWEASARTLLAACRELAES